MELPRTAFRGVTVVALRILVLILALLSRLHFPYLLLRVFGGKFKSFLLCYPGNEHYASYYAFSVMDGWLKWFPTPLGIYKQGRYWGVIVATTMTEQEFTNPTNVDRLSTLIKRLNRLATLAGAERVHLAGILPSFLEKRIPDVRFTPNDLVAKVVAAAAAQIIADYFGDEPVPVIILGGNGKLGKALRSELPGRHNALHVVDPGDGLLELPPELHGGRCLLIDVSRKDTLDKYLGQLWPEMVILNEAFPEPQKRTRIAIAAKGIKLLHLSGVVGRVFPSLPHGYAEAVPCCAMHDLYLPLQPVIREL